MQLRAPHIPQGSWTTTPARPSGMSGANLYRAVCLVCGSIVMEFGLVSLCLHYFLRLSSVGFRSCFLFLGVAGLILPSLCKTHSHTNLVQPASHHCHTQLSSAVLHNPYSHHHHPISMAHHGINIGTAKPAAYCKPCSRKMTSPLQPTPATAWWNHSAHRHKVAMQHSSDTCQLCPSAHSPSVTDSSCSAQHTNTPLGMRPLSAAMSPTRFTHAC